MTDIHKTPTYIKAGPRPREGYFWNPDPFGETCSHCRSHVKNHIFAPAPAPLGTPPLPPGAPVSEPPPQVSIEGVQDRLSAWDTQVGGSHYKELEIQPMEYSMRNKLDALQHTIVKYVTRFRSKGGVADLEKAKHCIDMLIEHEREHGQKPTGTR